MTTWSIHRGCDARALEGGARRVGAELEGGDVLERAHVLRHGRSCAAQDHDVFEPSGLTFGCGRTGATETRTIASLPEASDSCRGARTTAASTARVRPPRA